MRTLGSGHLLPCGLREKFVLLALLLVGLVLSGCSSKYNQGKAEERVARGWEMYRAGEFSIAVSIFQSVERTELPASESYRQAVYGEASCWNYRRDDRNIAKALELYHSIITLAPTDPLAAWCALDIVHAAHYGDANKPVSDEQLAQAYDSVCRQYPDTPAGEEAFLFAKSLALYHADAPQAHEILVALQSYINAHPDTPYLSALYKLMALAWHCIGDEDQRLDYLVKALQAHQNDPTVPFFGLPSAYWEIAYVAEYEAGNFNVARDYYQRLVREFPRDMRVLAAQKALIEMDQVESDVRAGRPLPADIIAGDRS